MAEMRAAGLGDEGATDAQLSAGAAQVVELPQTDPHRRQDRHMQNRLKARFRATR